MSRRPISFDTVMAIVVTALIVLAVSVTAAWAQQQARWHRYAQTILDANAIIDTVRDTFSEKCYAVYRARVTESIPVYGNTAGVSAETLDAIRHKVLQVSAVSLGEVPCRPQK